MRSVIQTDNPAAAAAADVWTAGVGLASSLETALAARADIPPGCALVTPQGDLVNAASVTFWAAEDPRLAILSREREIAELTHQVEALDEAAAAADDARTAAQKAEADARGRAEVLQREVVELERRTAKLVLEEREARSAWEVWQRREADLRRSREEMEIEAERAQERVEAALGAVETKTEALDEIQHAAGEAAAAHDRLHDRLIDLKRAAAESIHREAMKKLEAACRNPKRHCPRIQASRRNPRSARCP